MAFDYEDKVQLQRLKDSIEFSRKKLDQHVKQRKKFLDQVLGRLHPDSGNPRSSAVNLMEGYVSTHTRLLAPNAPQIMLTVSDPILRPSGKKLELKVNHYIEHETKYEETLYDCVFDALLSPASQCKVGLVEVQGRGGYTHDGREPFVDYIAGIDWVHDMMANKYETKEYAGDRSPMLLEQLKDQYPEHADKLKNLGASRFNIKEEDRMSGAPGTRLFDYMDVWSIWVPSAKQILLMPGTSTGVSDLVLEAIPWKGPENGPYYRLEFSRIPGMTMSLAPAASVSELGGLHDALFNKSSDQALNQKDVGVADRSSLADGQRIAHAEDRGVVGANGAKFAIHHFPGADPSNLSFGAFVQDQFSKRGGNLDQLDGSDASADTLGQTEILFKQSFGRIDAMRKKVHTFNRDILEHVAFLFWDDRKSDFVVQLHVPTTKEKHPVGFKPIDREADFMQLNVSINPYSERFNTPEMELALLFNALREVTLPNLDRMREQGITVDFAEIHKKIGLYGNTTMFDDLLLFTGGNIQSNGPTAPRAASPGGSAGVPGGQGGPSRDFQQVASSLAREVSGRRGAVENVA